MIKQFKLSIYTFISVSITVFILGYIGVSFSLDYMQERYMKLQLDANKRQAINMAKIMEYDLENGASRDELLKKFQSSIENTRAEKGFLCLFDQNEAKVLCHPNPKMVGMKVGDKGFIFSNIENNKKNTMEDLIKSGEKTGGLIFKKHAKQAHEMTFFIPLKGTKLTLTLHENLNMIEKEVKILRDKLRLISIILGISIAFFASWIARSISYRYEKKIENQNLLLDKNLQSLKIYNEEIKTQKIEIEEKNDNITASINYAKRIQEAILPQKEKLDKAFEDYFLYFKPRDIVSGDFYWFAEANNKQIIASVDCTGHGVPGAFMSMIGNQLLNQIINVFKIDSPEIILSEMDKYIKKSLKQNETKVGDGMDMSVCVIDKKNKILEFAGAKNPLVYIQDEQLFHIKGDKISIGGIYDKNISKFKKHKINLHTKTYCYIFSDGYQDQFGGEKNRKFMIKNMKKLFEENHKKKMKEQKNFFSKTIEEWQGKEKQIDDILLIGFVI